MLPGAPREESSRGVRAYVNSAGKGGGEKKGGIGGKAGGGNSRHNEDGFIDDEKREGDATKSTVSDPKKREGRNDKDDLRTALIGRKRCWDPREGSGERG